MLEAAKFADRNGFAAVWTPERHFHRFGGLYPNPAVLGAALAAITRRIQIRAGSVIAPLQSPVRIAEEWALVDNLSQGRTGIAFATGFHPVDFMLSPERFKERWKLTAEVVEAVRRYWRGEPARGPTGTGEEAERLLFPRPVQRELPTWLTATRATDTFIQAGRTGVNVLTALLRISVDEMAEKIAAYRSAREENGHAPEAGTVTLMLHAFAGSDDDEVRRTVSGPFREYLRSHLEFLNSTGAPLSPSEERNLLSLTFDRFYEGGSLFGTPESCLCTVEKLAAIGVNEIACLIDFGIDFDATMGGLHHLVRLAELANRRLRAAAAATSEPSRSGFLSMSDIAERIAFLSPEKRALLAARLAEIRASGARGPANSNPGKGRSSAAFAPSAEHVVPGSALSGKRGLQFVHRHALHRPARSECLGTELERSDTSPGHFACRD